METLSHCGGFYWIYSRVVFLIIFLHVGDALHVTPTSKLESDLATQSIAVSDTFEAVDKVPCLIVYHVGKSGGETLHYWFLNQGLTLWTHYGSGGGEIFDLPSDRAFEGASAVSIHEADVIMGHFRPFSKQGSFIDILSSHNVTDRKCHQWTVLRDPLERAYSLVKYLHRFPSSSQDEEDTYEKYQTQQVHLLETIYNNSLSVMFGTGAHWNLYHDPSARLKTSAEIISLADVKRNMMKLDGVGFLHDLEFCYLAWQQLFNLPAAGGVNERVFTRIEMNVNSRGDSFNSIPLEFQTSIILSNMYDIIVYRWALEVWKHCTSLGYAAQILLDIAV